MSVILNETKEAEHIMEKGELGSKPAATLFLLGRYYSQKEKSDTEQVFEKLNDFMQQHYKNYNPALWETILDNISKKAPKYPLREIDSIGITQYELDKISKAANLNYQRLLFTMLCYAKLYHRISENNNGWVNTPIKEIYQVARVTVKHRDDKFLYLNDLEHTCFISFSNKNDNLNIQINFLNASDDAVLIINDFRELGYEYLNYIGNGKFIRCTECGRLVKQSGRNTHYCTICKQEKRLESKRNWWRNND